MMNKLLTLMLLIAISGLFGCNTMEGAGKDLQSGGDALSETARDVKKDL
ncbi:putative small secreted protein [Thiocystis violascens DSM 198]|uniref:Putative small secreted protein n=1 Tax=Thiocystis violascens (strain ATCC 17096 / DSM 198 / 6111) TaxID=765911 RepID=I3YBX0_THIV6|nr:putative small secreted protein [Thiocystis violascens DSM 198]